MRGEATPRPRRRRRAARARALAVVALLAVPASAPAAPATLRLDPAATTVRFELGATLHRVEGTAQLVAGEIRFDREGGPAEGLVVVDARSADTGNGRRDATLHADVLESERFPEITFAVERIDVESLSGDRAALRVSGTLTLHGDAHPLVVSVRARTIDAQRDRLALEADFPVPYVAWGLRDPGNFVLRVDPVVQVHVEAVGQLTPALP